MIQFIQEAAADLPRLSQSSLFNKFDKQSGLLANVKKEITSGENRVSPADMKDIMALIRLNGSPTAKQAASMFESGKLVLIFNKDRSTIPPVLPYIIVNGIPYVFADKVVTNLTSASEYPNLMAAMEAAYLAAALVTKPNQFLLNRQFMLSLASLYNYLWIMPLEQKLYVKGDNLTKAMMYVTSYFYRMIDGNKMNPKDIPFNRILKDRVPQEQIDQIVMEVKMMPSMAIGNLIELIKKINPVRYENLDAVFMSYFIQTCGQSLVFGLENIQYLFLLITSANYKTKLTAYGLNKTASDTVKKCVSMLSSMRVTY